MKPTQGESHHAENMYRVLDAILKLAKGGKGVSDITLIRTGFFYSHTVRNIRKKLLNMKIIEQDLTQKPPNNEKVYKICSIKKARQLRELNWEISQGNTSKKILGKFYKRFGIRIKETFVMRYKQKPKKLVPETYPGKLYRKKICPICSKKGLREFKHGGPIDRRCHYCKYTFQYGQNFEGLMRAVKN